MPEGPDPRILWQRFEPIHALTYFAPECRDALRSVGLRGFWMGYFAARAAPLGEVDAGVVTAVFFNFNGTMVRRSIPDAWGFAGAPAILRTRRTAAASALRRVFPSVGERAVALVPLLRRVVENADGSGRVLFSANRQLGTPTDPVEALWQCCTALREHRGDGHVVALTAAGLDGCEALVLFAVSENLPSAIFRENRGWSDGEWQDACRRLAHRGLLDDGVLSAEGRELHRSIEELTDELAAPAFSALSSGEQLILEAGLSEVAQAVLAAGAIPFPNPVGLPPPGTGA